MVTTSTGVVIDDATKTVRFNPYNPKKISGSRIASILGKDNFKTEFQTACEIAKINPPVVETPRMRAGDHSEPLVRDYLRRNIRAVESLLGIRNAAIEDPVAKEVCGYEHFPNMEPFGGLVDGYVLSNGRRVAVLEIKTVKSSKRWFDSAGRQITPENYHLQASLYCALSGLDKILFVVAELPDVYLPNIKTWVPTPANISIRAVNPLDMTRDMAYCRQWYDRYIRNGVTPVWTDKDEQYVNEMRTIHSITATGQTVYRPKMAPTGAAQQAPAVQSPPPASAAPAFDNTVLVDAMNTIGKSNANANDEIFLDPVRLSNALKDFSIDKGIQALTAMILKDYGHEIRMIGGPDTDVQINNLSSKIASERYVNELVVKAIVSALVPYLGRP